MPADDPLYSLLALCARGEPHPTQIALLQSAAAALPGWEELPARAEAHGLAPLAYSTLAAAGVSLPPAARAQLVGYVMQHAHASAIRTKALHDILALYAEAGIEVLVLKGAALAHMVYPQPQLRPMRDIDLLVRGEEVYRAYALLPQIGFIAPPSPHYGLGSDHHHLSAIKRVDRGYSVSLEVHHALHLNERGDPLRFEAYAPTAQAFSLAGVTALTLGREETLWHIYRHALCMPVLYEPTRLIWLADLISLVEAWVELIDWERVRRLYRGAWHVLPLLHSLSPWSERVLTRLRLPVDALPSGAGAEYAGWPRFTLAEQRGKGLWRTLSDSVFPPSWWLRAYYGAAPGAAGYGRAWLAHQRWLAEQAGHVVLRELRHHARRLPGRR